MTKNMPDIKKTLEVLAKKKNDRKAVTLFISEALYTKFRKMCGKAGASAVIEEWIREAIESNKK